MPPYIFHICVWVFTVFSLLSIYWIWGTTKTLECCSTLSNYSCKSHDSF